MIRQMIAAETPKIMQEALLRWSLNGQIQPEILCSPGNEEYLIVGRLLTAGLVRDRSDIVHIQMDNGVVHAEAELQKVPFGLAERLSAMEPLPPGPAYAQGELDKICSRLAALGDSSGRHVVMLCWRGQHVLGQDIGRHNALEKAVGFAAASGFVMAETVLCSSGRLSLEMLAKAAAAGIPVLCTAKHVGTLCADYASRLKLAVYQYGEHQPYVFGAEWRVIQEGTT